MEMARAIGCLASFPLVATLACSDDAPLGGDESSGSDGSSGTTVDPDGSDSSAGMSASSVDGSSSGAPDTSSSSRPAPELCGNGDLDEGEGCDDGNLDDGDACRADCTIAFEVAWTQLHNGAASNADAVA